MVEKVAEGVVEKMVEQIVEKTVERMVETLRKLASLGLLVSLVVTGTQPELNAQEAVSRGGRQQSVAPAHELSLLERMQDEVAKIARQTRSGIVTIQDVRTWQIVAPGGATGQNSSLSLQRDQSGNSATSPSAPKLQQELADLQAKITNQEVLLRGLRAKGASESEVEAAEYDRERYSAQLFRARVLLALQGVGDPSRQEKALLEASIAMAEVESRHLAMEMRISQARAKSGLKNTEPLKASMDRAQAAEEKVNALRKKLQEVAAHYETSSAVPLSPFGPIMGDALGNTLSIVPKSGSGFSIGDGYILTTADVVTGMVNPIATTDTGDQLRLRLVALDPELNVALMRIPGNPPLVALPALTLGDSSAVVPGHFAISIGNHAGQINSVALSMVSGIRTQGLNSSSHFYPALLQIDGVIGAGNSGAPVINARGEVIGMVAAALSSESETSRLPSGANVNAIFNTITENGPILNVRGSQYEVQNGTGIPLTVYDKTPRFSKQSGLDGKSGATQSTANGVLNSAVTAQSSNQRTMAGARQAQTGTSGSRSSVPGVNSTGQQGETSNRISPPRTSITVQQFVGNGLAGDGNRPNGMTGSASLTGFAIPVNSFKCLLPALKTGVNIVHAWLGTELEERIVVGEYSGGLVHLERHVLVRALYAGGPAAKSGALRPGDVLVSINGRPITTANDVRAVVLVQLDPGQKVELQIVRNGTPQTVSLPVEARPTIMPPLEGLRTPAQSQSR